MGVWWIAQYRSNRSPARRVGESGIQPTTNRGRRIYFLTQDADHEPDHVLPRLIEALHPCGAGTPLPFLTCSWTRMVTPFGLVLIPYCDS